MVTRIVTELHDDIDGSDATQTIRFAMDGTEYEIDLSDRDANRFGKALPSSSVMPARVSGRRGRKAVWSPGARMSNVGQMREWLMEHGYDVSERGRVPAWLQQVYHDRH